jgi:TonB family protein
MRLIALFLAVIASLDAQCTGGDGKLRQLIHKVDPGNYPEVALVAGIKGHVELRLVVSPDGVPREITVVRPLGYGLDESAVKAVSQWRFSPCEKEMPVTVEVNFHLGSTRRFQPGPMVFESEPGTVKPVLTGFSEPDLSGSLTTNATGEVEFTVDPNGRPINFHVLKPVESKAERSVLHALALWTFQPAGKDGQSVSARGRVEYHVNP